LTITPEKLRSAVIAQIEGLEGWIWGELDDRSKARSRRGTMLMEAGFRQSVRNIIADSRSDRRDEVTPTEPLEIYRTA
jgi:hypothetical protein